MNDLSVAAEAIEGARLQATARRHALLFLIALCAASWLCILDDGASRAHERSAAAQVQVERR